LDLGECLLNVSLERVERNETRRATHEARPARAKQSSTIRWRDEMKLPVRESGADDPDIQAETGCRVQIKGLGSGFMENETGREAEEPMHISMA